MKRKPDKPKKHYFNVLLKTAEHVLNEQTVILQYESIRGDGFPNLYPNASEDETFETKMNLVIEHLGGPPETYLVRDGMKAPPADNYPEAALREALAVFSLARRAVIRADMFERTTRILTETPELWAKPDDEISRIKLKLAENAFWEHAEAAYVKLYSFWDRVAQILDFGFFNIRKFDRNGFTSVMDRIHDNVVPMNSSLAKSMSWSRLRQFQTSEKDDGLKVLLRRRNLMVHSLHLHPVEQNDERLFTAQFNHLEVAHREKLRPRTPSDEVDLLNTQLQKISDLFDDVLVVIKKSPARKVNKFITSNDAFE